MTALNAVLALFAGSWPLWLPLLFVGVVYLAGKCLGRVTGRPAWGADR